MHSKRRAREIRESVCVCVCVHACGPGGGGEGSVCHASAPFAGMPSVAAVDTWMEKWSARCLLFQRQPKLDTRMAQPNELTRSPHPTLPPRPHFQTVPPFARRAGTSGASVRVCAPPLCNPNISSNTCTQLRHVCRAAFSESARTARSRRHMQRRVLRIRCRRFVWPSVII